MNQKTCLFIGSKQLGLKSLESIWHLAGSNLLACVTFDDSKDIRSTLEGFKNFSEKSQLPIEILYSFKQLKKVIEKYQPDFCVVIGWYWILDESVLTTVPYGFYGVHSSLLPKYRGGSPLVWQLINGEKLAGVTLFQFDEGMDTGKIFGQESFALEEEDTIYDALIKAENSTLKLLEKQIPMFLRGIFQGQSQENSATYCSMRKPEDGLVNWQWTFEAVHNFIRAQTKPYPGAFSYRENGEKLVFIKSKKFAFNYHGIPGRVNQQYGDGVIITCGQGAIILEYIQLENGDCVKAKDVLKFGETLK